MKKSFISLLLAVALSVGMFSCSDGSVGSSISQTTVEIVMDSSFTVSGGSVHNYKIESRTLTQLLGEIKSDDYGQLKSDVVTQFMPSLNLDTTGVTAATIDSVKLLLRIPLGGFTGDSITPMRLNVYGLNKQLPSDITSDFDPKGYYSESDVLGSTSYNASALGYTDSVTNLRYRQITVDFPRSFGVSLFEEYKKNPSTFLTPSNFAKFFPGVYIANTYGSGRMMNISNTELDVYYRNKVKIDEGTDTERDTSYNLVGTYMAVTPEVITNNNIKMKIASSVEQRVANGEIIIEAPAGLDATIQFPIQQIIDKFLSTTSGLKVVNNLYFEIPVSLIQNNLGIAPPPNLLLVKTSEKDKFFAESKIVDNKTSFYAVYNSTSKKYIFSEMRDYVIDILENQNGIPTADDMNFTLTPVSIETETDSNYGTSTITAITPYVASPVIVKLNLDDAKIKFIYSKQTSVF